jgi:hypothetical protein
MKTTILLLSVALMLMAQSTTVHVRELPPETIPRGTCIQGHSGYLGVEGQSRSTLSERQVGEYILSQMRQGYSIALYPQPNGRIFSIATCETNGAR